MVSPVTAPRDLSVYIDADGTMRTHGTNTVRACFAALHQIRGVRRSLPQHALLTLIRTLVITSWISVTRSTLWSLWYLQDRLQSIIIMFVY